MPELNRNYPKRHAGGAVRVSVPAAVANDHETFKKGIAAFAERLGCPECFSGFDCTFESEREFALRPNLSVTRSSVAPGQAASAGAGQRAVTAPLSPRDEWDLGSILKKIDIIIRDIGAHWEQGGQAFCCSGFDVTFEREMRYTLGADGNLLR